MMHKNELRTVEIIICMGSSCFSRGNNQILKTLKEYIDRNALNGQVMLKGSLCEGKCKEGPNITIDGVAYDHVDRSTIIDILGHHLKNTAINDNTSTVIVKGTGNE